MTFQIGDTVEAAVDPHLVTDVSSDGNWVHLNHCLVATPAMILRKVEPSIPISKLREVFEERVGECRLRSELMLLAMFKEITGQPLRKETP